MTLHREITTSLAIEIEEQKNWRLRSNYKGLKFFDQILHGEFLSSDEQHSLQHKALVYVVDFAASQVPYYRQKFASQELSVGDFLSLSDLPKLPILSKEDLRLNQQQLNPDQLPPGEQHFGEFSTSGTTGRPIKIPHTVSSNAMFTFLAQRQYRWFRFDPMATIAVIRLATQLPRDPKTGLNLDGETQQLPRWRYVGAFFETGPTLGFNITTPIEHQLKWLCDQRPEYLVTYSESLEHLSFASGRSQPVDSLLGLHAISEQLTPTMRRGIEMSFGAPVEQNYGLNEIGLAAVRCAAGRYHVHAEHCIIEIVDEHGLACRPGEVGRIIVTALRNLAMPLLRYDTDDLAMAVSEPCPCGRTLPSFGEISGRYSRIAYLPEGTLGLVAAIREALEVIPAELTLNLRRYQLHQTQENGFIFRLATVGPLPEAFYKQINASWESVAGARSIRLEIIQVDEIPRDPSGKFQDFTSDYMPVADIAP